MNGHRRSLAVFPPQGRFCHRRTVLSISRALTQDGDGKKDLTSAQRETFDKMEREVRCLALEIEKIEASYADHPPETGGHLVDSNALVAASAGQEVRHLVNDLCTLLAQFNISMSRHNNFPLIVNSVAHDTESYSQSCRRGAAHPKATPDCVGAGCLLLCVLALTRRACGLDCGWVYAACSEAARKKSCGGRSIRLAVFDLFVCLVVL
jgi:hypothetical protein